MNLDAIRGEDEILRVLRAAQERIRDPNEQLCAWGALNWVEYQATGNLGRSDSTARAKAFDYLNIAAREEGYGGFSELNDRTDHPTVMAMFDRAQELRLADMMEAAVA